MPIVRVGPLPVRYMGPLQKTCGIWLACEAGLGMATGSPAHQNLKQIRYRSHYEPSKSFASISRLQFWPIVPFFRCCDAFDALKEALR